MNELKAYCMVDQNATYKKISSTYFIVFGIENRHQAIVE